MPRASLALTTTSAPTHRPPLPQLDLSDNAVGLAGAAALAAYLRERDPHPCSLKRLFLRNCHITDYECEQFAAR